tara:strand:+ start:2521 stop:3954 length:1434 start_codon:yes stop_codon:yes gene_type:complete
MALANSLPKEEIRALLATEMHRRLEARKARWVALDGPQKKFVNSEHPHVLFGGARGGSKSVGMLLAFRKHAERYGREAQGLLFRRTYPETGELVKLGQYVFVQEGWEWKVGERKWVSPSGSVLQLKHLDEDADAMKLQGFSVTFLGFDELGNWPSPEPIDLLQATMRSAAGVPVLFRASANPGGPGHGWVKERYIDSQDDKKIFIPSKIQDNKPLMENDPGYIDRIKMSGPEWLVKAWLDGDWNIAPGAYFENVWNPEEHVIEPFEMPHEWRRWKAYDHGYKSPAGCVWFAQDYDGIIYLYRELYWCSKPNKGSETPIEDIAREIVDVEEKERKLGIKFRSNVADSAIFIRDGRHKSVADVFADYNVIWEPSSKGPGSRVQGLQEFVDRLNGRTFKVFNTCKHWLRTVPSLPADTKKIEDIDTAAEDHLFDATRYGLMTKRARSRKPTPKKEPPARWTDEWLNNLDDIYREEEAWII